MLSCSFSSSRWSSAAVSGLGCRIGPCSWPCEDGDLCIITCGGRGEFGRLLLLGKGGGPITAEVRRESPGLACCELPFMFEVDATAERRGCKFHQVGQVLL